jgi:hypothetical protein
MTTCFVSHENTPTYFAPSKHFTRRADRRRANTALVMLNLLAWCYATAAGISAIT